MWTYKQATGELSHDTLGVLGRGYSGHGEGVNNTAMEHIPRVGPIPRGHWSIGAPRDSERVGPFALALTPEPDTQTFGRTAFLIHGDNRHRDQSASHGCIIMPRVIREAIHDSDDTDLEVI
jgi:type VI secretion system (T6SS) effector TldE1-like protein